MNTKTFIKTVLSLTEYLDCETFPLWFYLHNPPHKPGWSRSQPEPRAVCAVPGRGHVAPMVTRGSPSGSRPIQSTQPRVTDSRTSHMLPATGETARHKKHISVTAAQSLVCVLSLFGLIMSQKKRMCSIFCYKNSLCLGMEAGNRMCSPFALTVDLSLFSSIFQSGSLLKMARILCRAWHSNTRHSLQMSCKIKTNTEHTNVFKC